DGVHDAGTVDIGYHYRNGTDYEEDNHPPVLTSGQVSPQRGTTETPFTYSVHYYDEDGDAPLLSTVFIDDDSGHEMVLESGDEANGIYTFVTNLSGGDHIFYFYFEDDKDGWDRAPEMGEYTAPFVHPDPLLVDGKVEPEYGTAGTIFTYSVRYLGNDDNPPFIKKVYIDDVGFDMKCETGDPSNGTYIYRTKLVLGEHRFYFYFENPAGQGARDPQEGAFSGPVVFQDGLAPSSHCTGPETSYSNPIHLDYYSSDDVSGVSKVELYMRFNEGGYSMVASSDDAVGSFSVDLPYGDGVYCFYTIAEDRVGHREAPPSDPDVSISADVTVPISTCTAPACTNVLPFTVEFAASDMGSGLLETRLWYRYAGEVTWIDSWLIETGEAGVFLFDPQAITPQYGDGVFEIMTISKDKAGNIETPPVSPDASVMVDRTAPSSLITCPRWTGAAPVSIRFVALDNLSGVGSISLWYRLSDGDWQASGLTESSESGSFEFTFPLGEGIYYLSSTAADVAGNLEQIAHSSESCIYDTSPPLSSARADSVVNQPLININYHTEDALTDVQSVHIYYRYSDFEGNADETLVDTGFESGDASGAFECSIPNVPGRYNFYVCASDVVDNTEGADGDPDATTLFDPRLALSTMEAPLYTTEATISVMFETSMPEDGSGFDEVRLYYRYGISLEEVESAEWASTASISHAPSGTLQFVREDGDGYYQFFTRARSASGVMEPVPQWPDAMTIADTVAPETSLTGPSICSTSEFEIAFSAIEPYGIDRIDVYVSYHGKLSFFETVYEMSGSVTFDTSGREGEFKFYSIGSDMAGNVEGLPIDGFDCSVIVDVLPPESVASTGSFLRGFPIKVTYNAIDTVSCVNNVALWSKFGDGEWADTGLTSESPNGSFQYSPPSGANQEGIYYFYTIALDEMGHVELPPKLPDAHTVVDWSAPITECSAPAYVSDGKFSLTYSSEDALSGVKSVSIWLKRGGEAWFDTGLSGSTADGAVSVDISGYGQGTYGLFARGLDKAGNLEELPGSPPVTIIFDSVPPESETLIPSEGVFTNQTPAHIPYSASDSSSGISRVELWFRFNVGEWQNSGLIDSSSAGEGSFEFMLQDEGVYEFASIAIDMAGNREALLDAPDGGKITYDHTKPISEVEFGSDYASSFPVTLSFSAQDAISGIVEVTLFVSINGSAFESTGLKSDSDSGLIEYSPLSVVEGDYRFECVAEDRCGNIETLLGAAETGFTFDATAPISHTSVSAGYSNKFPLKVSFTAEDSTSGVSEVHLWASINGGGFQKTGLISRRSEGAFTFVPQALNDGTYAFFALAIDRAGVGEEIKSLAECSITVDRERPVSSCSVRESLTGSFPIAIEYTSSDDSAGIDRVELFYRKNQGDWVLDQVLSEPTGEASFAPEVQCDGYYEFCTAAFDKAQNEEIMSGADDSVTVDMTPPESTASCPKLVELMPVSVSFIARDDGAGVDETSLWCRYNNDNWKDSGLSMKGTIGSFEFNAQNGPGIYRFYTISTDLLGNIERAPVSPDAICTYSVPQPEIHLSTKSIEFGEVAVGTERTRTLSVWNIGKSDLIVSDVSVSALMGNVDAFSIDYGAKLPAILGPDESLSISTSFHPGASEEYGAELLLTSNDLVTPKLTIDLAGRGTVGQLTMDVRTNSDHYRFGDTLTINIGCDNSAISRTVDAYLILTYDPSGPDERTWFATPTGGWTESIA
ncbi:MAG: hypothetical protein JW941_09550, partial [Candidatus Coatesbacteria bacterium]|nr:hypothetical protein [Candidatus Coatesbacteria bacterium]